jgi:hypothetical protein
MANKKDTRGEVNQKAGVEAVVEPIKAIGGLIGFGIGFLAAHRSGADLTSSAMHGLLGAALLWIVAWFLAVYLVREMMASHVEEQRRMYTERVEAMRAQTQGGAAQGTTQSLSAGVPRAQLGPPGS